MHNNAFPTGCLGGKPAEVVQETGSSGCSWILRHTMAVTDQAHHHGAFGHRAGCEAIVVVARKRAAFLHRKWRDNPGGRRAGFVSTISHVVARQEPSRGLSCGLIPAPQGAYCSRMQHGEAEASYPLIRWHLPSAERTMPPQVKSAELTER